MTLYIVATPIGNLKDISQRALEVLNEADLILAEDTRHSRNLLNFYNIKKPIISYHQHSKRSKLQEIKRHLISGKKIALICDAGTPGISDPAGKLVRYLSKEIPKIKITPIPGPSALIAALSVSGFPANQFLFAGFPPAKRKRKRFFKEALKYPGTIVIFESPHRLRKSLDALAEEMKTQRQQREIFLIKEISKRFEKCWRGEVTEVFGLLKEKKLQGEFVIVLSPINFK